MSFSQFPSSPIISSLLTSSPFSTPNISSYLLVSHPERRDVEDGGSGAYVGQGKEEDEQRVGEHDDEDEREALHDADEEDEDEREGYWDTLAEPTGTQPSDSRGAEVESVLDLEMAGTGTGAVTGTRVFSIPALPSTWPSLPPSTWEEKTARDSRDFLLPSLEAEEKEEEVVSVDGSGGEGGGNNLTATMSGAELKRLKEQHLARLRHFQRQKKIQQLEDAKQAKRDKEDKQLQLKIVKAQGPKHYKMWLAQQREEEERMKQFRGLYPLAGTSKEEVKDDGDKIRDAEDGVEEVLGQSSMDEGPIFEIKAGSRKTIRSPTEGSLLHVNKTADRGTASQNKAKEVEDRGSLNSDGFGKHKETASKSSAFFTGEDVVTRGRSAPAEELPQTSLTEGRSVVETKKDRPEPKTQVARVKRKVISLKPAEDTQARGKKFGGRDGE